VSPGRAGFPALQSTLGPPGAFPHTSSASPVAIRMTWTALPITSAGRFSPLGPRGMSAISDLGYNPPMEYRGIRYTLRRGISPGRWSIAIHPTTDDPIELAFTGPQEAAELRARSMIDTWLKSHREQVWKNSN
jgi:hypothetical protein